MRRVLRHVLILASALALVANGAAWRQCTGLQLAAAATHVEHGSHVVGHHAQTTGFGEHDHRGMHHLHMAEDGAPPATPANDHDCTKCCAMCTAAIMLPSVADSAVTLIVSSPVFYRDDETGSGNTVAVDPGIPKRIA